MSKEKQSKLKKFIDLIWTALSALILVGIARRQDLFTDTGQWIIALTLALIFFRWEIKE